MINYFIIMVWDFCFLRGGDLEGFGCLTSVHYRADNTQQINRNSEQPVKASLNRQELKILMLPQCQQETMLGFKPIKQGRNTTQVRSFADFTWWNSSFSSHSVLAALEQHCYLLQLEMFFYLRFYKDPRIQTELRLLSAFNSNPQNHSAPLRHISNIFLIPQVCCSFSALHLGVWQKDR